MELRNGRHIHRRVKDSSGDKGYVFWVQDCYFPTFYLVRGENFTDAYDWFLCDPKIEQELKVENDEFLHRDLDGKTIEQSCEDGTLTFNDNGVMMWSDNEIHGMELREWFNGTAC